MARYREQVREHTARLRSLRAESSEKVAAAKTPERREQTRQRYRRRIAIAERRGDGARGAARGTFRTMGGHLLAMLSGGGAADRTAIATEGIKRDTGQLVRRTPTGGPTFGA